MNNKKVIRKIALDLKLHLDDDLIEQINNEWDFFNESLKIINQIDTEKEERVYSPNFSQINYLREDIIEESNFDQSVLFKNAKRSKDNLFIMKKVIK
jgi:Asp-tRNA(Asn)/Glu-tRNA(Gln) amidotransferase C subunit